MIYFSMGGRCAHFSNYMGPWCLTNSDYIGGGVRPISNSVVVVLHSLRRGEERILSANRLINVASRGILTPTPDSKPKYVKNFVYSNQWN